LFKGKTDALFQGRKGDTMKSWIQVCHAKDVLVGGGGCVKLGGVQIALFRLPAAEGGNDWYAVQNLCPHDGRQVLSRGLTGDAKGEPKVACPLHKNSFSLRTGAHLAGTATKPEWSLETFPVREVDGLIFLEFDTARLTPPPEAAHDPPRASGLPN
jgi:nitrite reductase (NADH) small subunit